MILIASIRKVHKACPAQWKATTADGEKVLITYRWGVLDIGVGPDWDLLFIKATFDLGDPNDGTLTFKKLKEVTKGKVEFLQTDKAHEQS